MVPLSRSELILLSSCKACLKQGGKHQMPKFGMQALSALPDNSKPAPPSILQFPVQLLSAGSSEAAPVWMVAPVSSSHPVEPQPQQLHRSMGRCHQHPPQQADISHQVILLLSNIRSQPGFSQGTLRASVCLFPWLCTSLSRAGAAC